MASLSGRKEGLRCDKIIAEEDNIKGKKPGDVCDDLLLEKDPELGIIGVRCGRCGKFHSLEELNSRAAEFENQKENQEEEMEEIKREDAWKLDMRSVFNVVEKFVSLEGLGEPKEMIFYWKSGAVTPVSLNGFHDYQTQWEKVQKRLEEESPKRVEYIYKKGPITVAKLVVRDHAFGLSETSPIIDARGGGRWPK